jgi:SAM-dependent methyltransferase
MIQLIDFNDAEGFDLIWMEQAFHHLEPRAEVLKKISQLLRPGGRVVLSEANALNPLLQLQLLRARGLKMFYNVQTDQGTVIYGNERVLSRRKLAKLLKSVQIEMEDSHYYRLFPSHPFFDSLFALEQKVSSPLFAPAFSHYNFVGRKVAARHT